MSIKRNMSLQKVAMPEQEPLVRNRNFAEVTLGYDLEQAQEEAARCLQCKHKPCMNGCPVKVRIPEFIAQINENNIAAAYDIITATNSLPAVCGRVCPQEKQCEELCVRALKGEAVGIGRLERFVADWVMQRPRPELCPAQKNGHKVAVIGAGPAGLTCAGDLARLGYEVTVFESLHVAGGVLVYGIPEFRLPKSIVRQEIAALCACGVKIETNMVIGRILSISELFAAGYEAIFIGSGAGLPSFMHIPGENLNDVYSANEFLTRINLMEAYKWPATATPLRVGRRVAVIGGGNVAMDAARSAKRLGAEEVYIVYRRSQAELPARLEEVHHAMEEGIIFKFLCNPVAILGDEQGSVTGLQLQNMELGEADSSGRRRPQAVVGSEHVLELESVIMAIGQSPNPLLRQTTPELNCAKWGGIIVDEATLATSVAGVYAGGDAVTGAATVILAMGAGKTAAASMHEYIQGKHRGE